VGKSTLLQHLLPELKCIEFDAVQDIHRARTDPDLFLESFPAPFILDEVQHVPALLNAIKRRVDQTDRPGQYFLTGSHNLMLLKTVSESLSSKDGDVPEIARMARLFSGLTGRVGILRLEGMTPAEMAGRGKRGLSFLQNFFRDPDFADGFPPAPNLPLRPLTELLWRGSLPAALSLPDELLFPFYESYVQTYVERDIRVVGDIRDLPDFGRFLGLVAALTAQEINASQFGREAGVSSPTAKRWLDMLQTTFQWFEIPAFHGNTLKRISGKRKGYVLDSGLCCFLQRISSPQALLGSPLFGALFESWVVAEIRKQFITLDVAPQMYHWRTSGGGEVDLVLERDGVLFPIEVKSSSHVTSHDSRGIRAFRDTYPKRQIGTGLLVYAGTEAFRLNSFTVAIPWKTLALG